MFSDSMIGIYIATALIGLSYFAGLKYWSLFWTGIGIWTAIIEWIAVKYTGKTISQQFWTEAVQNPTRTWIVFGVYAVFFIVLLLHLRNTLIKV